MSWLGIDIGSRQVKLAIEMNEQTREMKTIPTPIFYRKYFTIQEDRQLTLDLDRLQLSDLNGIGATGYGRNNIGYHQTRTMSEIQAHSLGVLDQVDWNQFLLLDLGGQDTKVILVENGHVEDFQINDKCAAGSGRYLENMAQVLGVTLDQLFIHYQDPIDLSTTCATYAESELVGKIADGLPVEQLCAGVNHSTFLRLRPMLEHWPVKQIVFVGGGAGNLAIKHYLQQSGYEVMSPTCPLHTGALGCLNYIKQEMNR